MSSINQGDLLNYAKICLFHLYSFITAVIYHTTSFTANAINEYPKESLILIGVTSVVVAIYLVKSLFMFLVRSVVRFIKFLFLIGLVFTGFILYHRGTLFFTVDLVNLYNAVSKDVSSGTVYSDQIYSNIDTIYSNIDGVYKDASEALDNTDYVQILVSKSDYIKKLIASAF